MCLGHDGEPIISKTQVPPMREVSFLRETVGQRGKLPREEIEMRGICFRFKDADEEEEDDDEA